MTDFFIGRLHELRPGFKAGTYIHARYEITNHEAFEAVEDLVRKVRCLGAAAAELCYVAAGFLGGTLYEGLKLWDFAAARIILQEAGGFFQTDETEPDDWCVLAGAADLHDALRSICLPQQAVTD